MMSKAYEEMLDMDDNSMKKLLRKLHEQKERQYIYTDVNGKQYYDIDSEMYNECMKKAFEKPMMCSKCRNILRRDDIIPRCLHGSKDYPNVLEFKCKYCGEIVLKYCYHNPDGTFKDYKLETRKKGIIDENGEYWEFF